MIEDPNRTPPEADDLDALAALCAAATPGPWFSTDRPDGVLRVSFYPLEEDGAIAATAPSGDPAYAWWVEFPGDMEEYEGADLANAAFIAASREAVPRLVAETRALRAFRDAIDAASTAYHSGAEWADRAVTRFDRAVRVALKQCQDELDKQG